LNPEELLIDSFRLNLYEAKVYIALTSGSMTPKQVSESAEVPLSRTYDTLRSLQAKGFVEERGDAFSAISARAALSTRLARFEQVFTEEQAGRRAASNSLLKVLGGRVRAQPAREQEVSILRGINAITSKFSEVINDSDDIILVVRKSIDAKRFFKPYLEKRTPKSTRVLVHSGLSLPRSDLSFLSRLGIQVKRADNLFIDLMVADDSMVIIGVPDPTTREAYHSIAVAISSQSFAQALRGSLEDVWAKAR